MNQESKPLLTPLQKLKSLMILCVEDFNKSYIKEIKDIGSNTYNVKVLNTFFIQTFNKYNNGDFELLEIYHNEDEILSIYLEYVGV